MPEFREQKQSKCGLRALPHRGEVLRCRLSGAPTRSSRAAQLALGQASLLRRLVLFEASPGGSLGGIPAKGRSSAIDEQDRRRPKSVHLGKLSKIAIVVRGIRVVGARRDRPLPADVRCGPESYSCWTTSALRTGERGAAGLVSNEQTNFLRAALARACRHDTQ